MYFRRNIVFTSNIYTPKYYKSCIEFGAIESYLKHNNLIPNSLVDNDETSESSPIENNPNAVANIKNPEGHNPENLDLHEEKMQRKLLRDLLNNIDFSEMDADHFISGPGRSNILTYEQKYYILSSINSEIYPIRLFDV